MTAKSDTGRGGSSKIKYLLLIVDYSMWDTVLQHFNEFGVALNLSNELLLYL